ncbi:MAG TPA: ATP-dependent helicase, partial [Acidimicrobiia bacterium]|nr:ATP-dependent helicase [Acidimicrobiia bacterium]
MAEPTDPGAVARALGRGAIVGAGGSAPVGWESAPRVVIDDAVVRDPASVLDELHGHWARREPVVVEVGVEVGALREPETETRAPYLLDPSFELGRERLYFLARSNNVDARSGSPVWGGALEAARLGASASAEADVVLPDGRRAWIDGGPRAGAVAVPDGHVVVHRVRVEEGSLEPDVVAGEPGELAPDQLAAVVHDAGPARIIAPAGSGKTRVLTERFRLLVRGRGWGSSSVTAVAYNVRAKDEMQSRLGDLSAGGLRSVRTLHSLGNAIVRAGSAVGDVIDERQVRERIQPLVEVRPKANTDMYAPYLEALGEVRLGLVPPAVVEAERDDVPGFASMFERYREGLARDRVIDHDEQIYGALEVLLRDVTVRRRFQRECRHLLVDEFQDLTPAQLLLLRLVAAPAYDVFGVGDDDQVIYGYAGADPDFLIRYDRFFPGAGFHDLEVNYRCPPDVVDAARTLLTYNRRRVPKTIRAARTADDGALTVVAAPAGELAGRAFASVQARLADGVAATDLAVLARVNSALLPIQVLCTDAGIPCWTPVAVSVLNRTGSTASLAYLRMANAIAAGKKVEGDDVDIALRRPPRGIPPQVRERIRGRRWTLEALGAIADGLSGKAHDGFLDLLLL